MPDSKQIRFLSHNRKARCAPNPEYPDGIDIDNGERPACRVELPYPAECCGAWVVDCSTCGVRVGITAAGRPDDPRSVMLPCRINETVQ